MATREITIEGFAEVVEQNVIVFLDFWAAWCGPCRMFAPVFEKASEQHADIVFGKIDTEDQQSLAGAANITSIPTLMALKDQTIVFSQAGALPRAALEELIEQIEKLDVKAALEAERAQREASGDSTGDDNPQPDIEANSTRE